MNIGVFDSGIGGLSVLEELVKQLPGCNFFFYGDRKNNPYGEKSDEQLLEITADIVRQLKKKKSNIIVIACNTATTRCRNALIKMFPELIFIGTVPAVKVACDKGFRNTLVMATPATVESERVSQLVRDNIRDDQNIYLAACGGLANAIEMGNKAEISRILDELQAEYGGRNIDSIVLGCTHYPFIRKQISERFPDVALLDGADGVARETRHQMEMHGWSVPEGTRGRTDVYFSSKD